MTWIDVQGAEREVIEGGTNTLLNTSYVWIEYGETQYEGGMDLKETLDLFENLGFKNIITKKNDLLLENRKIHDSKS